MTPPPQVDILIANPLRLRTLVEEGKVTLAHVRGRGLSGDWGVACQLVKTFQ